MYSLKSGTCIVALLMGVDTKIAMIIIPNDDDSLLCRDCGGLHHQRRQSL